MDQGDRRPAGTRWRGVVAVARRMSAAMTAGFISGLLIGGVGGRIAMLILRLTSDPSLRGLQTDDDFTIGIVSSATIFLLGLTAASGVLGGLIYLGVRSWLPERSRPWLFGALGAVVGGTIVIRPNGIDFQLLDPLTLAVTMFIALPAIYGVVTSLLAERFLERSSLFARSRVALAGLVLLLPFAGVGLFGLVGIALIAAALVLGVTWPGLGSVWSSAPVTWLGRAGLAAIGILASVALVRDLTAVF